MQTSIAASTPPRRNVGITADRLSGVDRSCVRAHKFKNNGAPIYI